MKKGHNIMVDSICLYYAFSEVLLVQLFQYVYLGLGFFGVRVLRYCSSVAENKFFTLKDSDYNL